MYYDQIIRNLERILDLTINMSDAIEAGDMERFSELLAERARFVETLQGVVSQQTVEADSEGLRLQQEIERLSADIEAHLRSLAHERQEALRTLSRLHTATREYSSGLAGSGLLRRDLVG